MQAAKRIALNTGVLYGRMGITIFISLYSTRLTLDALGVKDFGLFNVVGGIILMLGFLNASMAAATQRFMSFAQGKGDLDNLKKIFKVSLLLHIIISVLLLALLELAGYILFNGVLNIVPERIEAAKVVYQFMVVSTLFTVISVPYDAVINARENMLLFAVLGIIEAVLKLLIAIYISTATGDRLIIYGLLTAVLAIFLLIIRVIYCQLKYKECSIGIRANYEPKLMKEMTGFAGWSLMGSSTSMIAGYGQGTVMNIFFGTAVNAAQGIASQISGQLGAFSTTMLRALNPTIAKSEGAGERGRMVQAAMIGSKVSFFLLMLFVLPAMVEMPVILKLWLKEVPPFAVIFCQLLLIRNLVEQLFLTLVTSIAAVGKIRKFQVTSSILTVFPLLITYWLYSLGYPAYTIYVVFIIYSIVTAFNVLYYSNRLFDMSYSLYFKEVIIRCSLSFIVTLLVALIPHSLMDEGLTRLLMVGASSSLAFLYAVWAIGLSKNERLACKGVALTSLKKFRGNKFSLE